MFARQSIVGLHIITTLVVVASQFACSPKSSFLDPQGHRCRTIVIGEQEWMTINLTYDAGDGCYYYDNDPAQCDEMGRLYTWEAALRAANEIPGWHLPSREEWKELINHCGDDSSTAYSTLVADATGFNPQPSGVRTSSGEFKAKGMKGANYWSSTICDKSQGLSYSVAIMGSLEIISPHCYPVENACSVRLIKDR